MRLRSFTPFRMTILRSWAIVAEAEVWAGAEKAIGEAPDFDLTSVLEHALVRQDATSIFGDGN